MLCDCIIIRVRWSGVVIGMRGLVGYFKLGYMEGSVCGCKRFDLVTAMVFYVVGNIG